jgi:2-methylcitrate dehydratase PrpD
MAGKSTLEVERAITRFIHGFSLSQLSEGVWAGIRTLIKDQLANEIGCSELPWSRQILEFTLSQRVPGTSRIVASNHMVSAADAAFVNATYGHGFEYDDAHRASSSHPGCCVIPTALAIGEELGSSLEEVLAALVVGYEVYTRIGIIAAPDLLARAFHPHAILSNFGAAAVVARLRKYDEATTTHAMAIVASHASGTIEYSSTGGSVKRVHAGMGVRNGIRSADMARAGITGPFGYLTGLKGFYHAFLQKEVGDEYAERFDLAQPFQIERPWIKPHCCCGCNHAYIDAGRKLAPRLSEIVHIDAHIQDGANVVVGNRNAHSRAPQTIEHVQYSLPIQMAFSLLGLGNGAQVHMDYLNGKLDMRPEGEILRTARMIEITPDPELDRKYADWWMADVYATFRDGSKERVLIENPIGTAENPVSQADLDAKFRELTVPVLGENRSERLRHAIEELDMKQTVSDFAALCSK